MDSKNVLPSNISKEQKKEQGFVCIKHTKPILSYPFNLSRVQSIYVKGNEYFRDIDLSAEELNNMEPIRTIICVDLPEGFQPNPLEAMQVDNNDQNNFRRGVKRDHGEDDEDLNHGKIPRN